MTLRDKHRPFTGPVDGPGTLGVPDREPLERAILGPRREDAAANEEATAVTRRAEEMEGEVRPTVDPLAMALAMPVLPATPGPSVESATRGPALDPMVAEIVQSLAWGGDRRRGAARIELGGKRFGGATVVVHAEGNAVTLELGAGAGVEVRELGERLRERLERRGLSVRVTAQ